MSGTAAPLIQTVETRDFLSHTAEQLGVAAEELLARAAGEPLELVGPQSLLAPLVRTVLETSLAAELAEHLSSPWRRGSRQAHGYYSRTVSTDIGPVRFRRPRDREGTFRPATVSKHARTLWRAGTQAVTLFATVDRLAEAEHQLAELFGPNVRQRTIARTADALLPKILSWRNRALGVAYPVLLLDTILTARERAIGAAIGIDLHGNRDLLGLWPLTGADHERPAWQPVATDLRLRGLNHVAIVCCDELTISTSAVRQSWPFAELRSSIMDVISNSLREQLMTR